MAQDAFELALSNAEVTYKFDCFDTTGKFVRFIASHGAVKVYDFAKLKSAIKDGKAIYDKGTLKWNLPKTDLTKAIF